MLRAHEPVDLRLRKRASQRGGNRNRMDDVAERAEADEEDPSRAGISHAKPRHEIARGMRFRIADDRDAPAVRSHNGALGHGIGRVVGALAVHVGGEQAQQPLHRRIGEHDHVVDSAQRRDELGAIARRRESDGPGPSAPRPIDRRSRRRSADPLRPRPPADSGRVRRAADRNSRWRRRASAPRRDRARPRRRARLRSGQCPSTGISCNSHSSQRPTRRPCGGPSCDQCSIVVS